jgi:predicted Zn finger-like uncharacterized protein
MPLVIACPGCSKQFRIGDEHAGKQVKCPACQTVFQVPAQQPATAPEDAAWTTFSPTPGNVPAKGADSAKSFGVASLVLGIISAVGELLSMMSVFFGSFCCLCLPFGLVGIIMVPTLLIPAGIGLALGFKARGNMKVTGIALNAIALGLGVLTILGMILMVLFFGGLAALQPRPSQPPFQPFPPPQF